MKSYLEILNNNQHRLCLITYRLSFIKDPYLIKLFTEDPYYKRLFRTMRCSKRPFEFYMSELAISFDLGSYQLARNLSIWITPETLYKSLSITSFLSENELPEFTLVADNQKQCAPVFPSIEAATKYVNTRYRFFSKL